MKKEFFVILTVIIAILTLIFSYTSYQKKLQKVAGDAEVHYKTSLASAEVRKKRNELEEKKENTDTILPQKIYVMEGHSNSIFFRNVIKGDSEDLSINLLSDFGEVTEDRWSLVTESGVNDKKPFTVELLDKASNILRTSKHELEVISTKNKNNQVNLLSIGDSMTRPNSYGKRVQEILPNIQTVGTRTYDSGITNGEGRGGWTLQFYISKIGEINGVDSPFLFPKEVAPEQYKGNVNFWKNVCYDNPDAYDYDGFQKLANGWDGEECLYEKNGYPKNPKKNDVVVDPNNSLNDNFLKFNGTDWQPINPKPEVEFSFSKYIAKNKAIFGENEPTIVSLLFGANDFHATDGLTGIKTFINNINLINDSVKSYNSDIKLVVNLPIIGSNQEVWEQRDGVIQGSAELYRENMQLLGRALLNEYDGREDEGIYIGATNALVDTSQLADHIHPDEVGYNQMGDVLGALIQKIR